MNKIIIVLLLAVSAAGCKKNDVALINGGLPEERMAQRLAELRSSLTGAQNGWIASLTTSAGGGYGFYMKFEADEKVLMIGDLDEDAASEPKTSTYRIKWNMNASLIFDTYNYISLLQDPVPGSFGGAAGSGYKSDIEFEYIRSAGDSLILRGKKYQNYLYLTKATAAQATAYQQGKLLDKIEELGDYLESHYNNYININGVNNKVSFVLNEDKTVAFQYANEKDSIVTVNNKFSFDLDGVTFSEGFVINGVKFKKGVLSGNTFRLYDDAGKEYMVAQNATPVIPFKLLFAYNKAYKTIMITGTTLPAGVSSAFNSIFNGMVSRFTSSGRTIQTVDISFSNSFLLKVNIWYLSGTTRFLADASFSYTYNDGVLTLSDYTPSVSNTNWTSRITQIGNFVDWLQSGPFRADWVAGSNPSVRLGGLYRVNDVSSFFYGNPQ